MKLNAENRNMRFCRSLILKFFVTARSLFQNIGPGRYGRPPLPSCPGPGIVKQFGLAYWFFCNPLLGLHVIRGYTGMSGVPYSEMLLTLAGVVRAKLVFTPPCAESWAPLSICVMPEICQPLPRPRTKALAACELGKVNT